MDLAKKNVLALVTGASRGFGRSISNALLRAASAHGVSSLALILHARSSSEAVLRHVECDMMARYLTARKCAISTALSITTLPLDLDRSNVYAKATRGIRAGKRALDAPIDHAILFNNAAVLLPDKLGSASFASRLMDSFTVNVAAPAAMCRAFLDNVPNTASRQVVLTSSLAAVKPFPSWAAYSASKAAADMLHACLAAERPDVRVLCYAPGAMRTDMTQCVSKDDATHPELKEAFAAMERENAFVNADQSAETLIELLLKDQFRSGEHIDFYDV